MEAITGNVHTMDENKKECVECSELFSTIDLFTTASKDYVCVDCRDDYYTCYSCTELFKKGDEMNDEDGNSYCESCADTELVFCHDCEETKREYKSIIVVEGRDNYTVCSDCAENYYTCNDCNETKKEGMSTCELCGDNTCDDCSHYCEHCENIYCSNCNCDCDNQELDTRKATSKPQKGLYQGKIVTDSRLFGVEIEAENGTRSDLDDIPEECGISEDGSLNDSGVEVQTPPASLDKGEYLVNKTCQALKSAGFEATRSCGLHVHLDASDARDNPVKMAHILRTFLAVEDLLFSMLPQSRWDNHYCDHIGARYDFGNFPDTITAQDFDMKWYKSADDKEIQRRKCDKYDSTRYCSVNLHSLFYRGTVEFRHHAGTVNADKILRWVSILQSILGYAMDRYDEAEITKIYKAKTNGIKIKRFFRLFKLPKDTQEYIRLRIVRFNPKYDFSVKSYETEGN